MVPGPAVVKRAIMRKAVSVLAMVMIAVCSVMGFEPPGPRQRLEAIGPTNGLSVMLRCALAPSDSFEPVPVPGASDWLQTTARHTDRLAAPSVSISDLMAATR